MTSQTRPAQVTCRPLKGDTFTVEVSDEVHEPDLRYCAAWVAYLFCEVLPMVLGTLATVSCW